MNDFNNLHDPEFENNNDNQTKDQDDTKNRKHLLILGFTTFSLFLVIIIVMLWQRSINSSELVDNSLSGAKYSSNLGNTSHSAPSESTDETHPTRLPLYILGEWKNKLAVFQAFGSEPFEIYEIYVTTLPQEEQDKLLEGIKIYSEEELASLIEDYTS